MNKKKMQKKYHKKKKNIKYFLTRFPHLPEEVVKREFLKNDLNGLIQVLIDYDYEENFKEFYENMILKSIRNDKEKKRMRFKEIKGDLFNRNYNSLAHCVSEDMAMSKGIALMFVKLFGKKRELKEQEKKVGDFAHLHLTDGRFVFYIISKKRYFMKPSYSNLLSSLENLGQFCKDNNVTNLDMPRIGCGLDHLNWNIVKNMIIYSFFSTNINIQVFRLK